MNNANKEPKTCDVPREEKIRFLQTDFKECFNHLRYHGGIRLSFWKFSSSFYIGAFAFAFTVYRFLNHDLILYIFLAILFILVSISGCVFLFFFVRNRFYSVMVARHLNSIRYTFLSGLEIDSIKRAPLAARPPDWPPFFKFNSLSSIIFYLTSLFNSIYFGLSAACASLILKLSLKSTLGISVGLGVLALALQSLYSIWYLKGKDRKNWDEIL